MPFLLNMSAPERVSECAGDDDVETFTQSSPAVVEGCASPAEIEAAWVIVRQVSGRRALEIMEGSYLDSLGYFRMMCAPTKRAWPDARCRRRLLPPELCGRTIPVAYQKRLMLMLILGHASSLSFNNDGRHRLITIWCNTLLRLQGPTGLGSPINAEFLIPPTKVPKPITRESPKAFEQLLETIDGGFLHTSVPRWQAIFPSALKLVSKVKASPLNLHCIAGGGG
jgi:hypothetical protein